MSYRPLNIKTRDYTVVIQKLKNKGVPLGKLLGRGCFCATYQHAQDPNRVIKLTLDAVQYRYYTSIKGKKNPHFPKVFSTYGIVGHLSIQKGGSGSVPLYMVETERLEYVPAKTTPTFCEKTHRLRSKWSAPYGLFRKMVAMANDYTLSGNLKTQCDVSAKAVKPTHPQLARALKQLYTEMNLYAQDLDLHWKNVMFRGDTLVLNDPVCDSNALRIRT